MDNGVNKIHRRVSRRLSTIEVSGCQHNVKEDIGKRHAPTTRVPISRGRSCKGAHRGSKSDWQSAIEAICRR